MLSVTHTFGVTVVMVIIVEAICGHQNSSYMVIVVKQGRMNNGEHLYVIGDKHFNYFSHYQEKFMFNQLKDKNTVNQYAIK